MNNKHSKYSKMINQIYRWEFLRRQESYIKDFFSLVPNAKKTIVATRLPSKIQKKFDEKYNVTFPVNPAYSVFKLNEMKQLNSFTSAFPILFSLLENSIISNDKYSPSVTCVQSHITGNENLMMLLDLESKDSYFLGKRCFKRKNKRLKTLRTIKVNPKNMDISKVTFNVDLSFPKLQIEQDLLQELDKWKNMYNNVYPSKKRNRYGEYGRYLCVYDDRNLGVSWEDLAIKYYSGDSARDKNYAIKKVKRDFKRCRDLVHGGYRQIR